MKVWIEFKKKITKDFHDLYLRIDVLLLANVFEEFRNMSLEYYGLDFSHYFSSPGLNWNVTLKKTGIKLGFVKMLKCVSPLKNVSGDEFLI